MRSVSYVIEGNSSRLKIFRIIKTYPCEKSIRSVLLNDDIFIFNDDDYFVTMNKVLTRAFYELEFNSLREKASRRISSDGFSL